MTVGITGASGYVGSLIEARLRNDGHSVLRLVRNPGPGDRHYELSSFETARTLAGIDTLIHCAWDMRLVSWRDISITNVEGSQRLLKLAESAGVSEMIFISSMRRLHPTT